MATWQKVFSTQDSYRAEIVKSILEDTGINAVILPMKDSSYNNFGQIEILVQPDDVIRALKIIQHEVRF